MPLYEWFCKTCGITVESFAPISKRNDWYPDHMYETKHEMQRLPGGHGLLHFEEGRPRYRDWTDKPITSHAEHERLKRANGLVEVGDIVPPSIKKAGPKHPLMIEKAAGTQKGRWY